MFLLVNKIKITIMLCAIKLTKKYNKNLSNKKLKNSYSPTI